MARYKVLRRAGYKQRRRQNPYWNLLQRPQRKLEENMAKIKYRENMTADEALALLQECERLDALYADAGPIEPEHKVEGSLAEFDRYIAGDR